MKVNLGDSGVTGGLIMTDEWHHEVLQLLLNNPLVRMYRPKLETTNTVTLIMI